MEINIITINEIEIAEVKSDKIIINNTQDALDIMADCSYQGATSIIFYQENITADFFDLKTKLAGDILQKFSTYNIRVAIVGDFSNYNSKSLNDFIYESNKVGRVNFVDTLSQAQEKLSR